MSARTHRGDNGGHGRALDIHVRGVFKAIHTCEFKGYDQMQIKTFRKTPDIHPIENVEVIDGDTIKATILLPFSVSVVKVIRLRDFWADELTGPYCTRAIEARKRLANFLAGKAVWLHSPSARQDRYGRVLGFLMHGERLIGGKEVLGDLQLTENEHKARRDMQKGREGIRAKGYQSGCVLGHPEAISGPPMGEIDLLGPI